MRTQPTDDSCVAPDCIADRIAEVKSHIAEACRRASRSPAEVTLVAVSKKVAASRCVEAVEAGQLELGENYAQELRDKAPQVPGARWHYIGPLQRNKVKYVATLAEMIQSLSSLDIAEELAKRLVYGQQRCLIQVNIGREPQKSGVMPDALGALLDKLPAQIACEGLMCIPPAEGDPRPHFDALRALGEKHSLKELSMGMSADYEQAIECGATIVRVGTAIFGTRS